jgi:peptidoglycan/LPS O-acetylase OafA/YrhL
MGSNSRLLSFVRPGAFRMFLALVVLVNHSCRIDLGDWAVYSFFILSGFWICRMWTEKYSKTDAPFLVFLSSRFLRILPIFWLANLLSAVAQHIADPNFLNPKASGWAAIPAIASNILIFGNANLPRSQRALDPAWSLDIEMQFYVIFPLIIYLFSRRDFARFWEMLFVPVCIGGLVWYLTRPVPAVRDLSCYGLFFLIGVIAARNDWAPSVTLASASLGVVVAFFLLCAALPGMRFLIENGKHGATSGDFSVKLAVQAVLALLSAPFALSTVRSRSGTIDRALSELTYVVYLMQWPIMSLHGHWFGQLPPFERLPSIVVAWIAVLALSWWIYRFVDRPLEEHRKRWVASHARVYCPP